MGDYVLNCTTVTPLFPNANSAAMCVAEMIEALAALDSDSEQLPVFRLPCDPWYIELARHDGEDRTLSLGEIANSFYNTENHDFAVFFDQLTRTSPADDGLSESTIDELLRLEPDGAAPGYEETFENVKAASFDATMCALTGSILVSLLRNSSWDFDRAGFKAAGSIYHFDHVAKTKHSLAIRLRRPKPARPELTARNFWKLKAEIFPNLLFGLDVERQITKFSATLLGLLFTRLGELDSRVAAWKAPGVTSLPDQRPYISQESKQTMANYGDDRKFRGHDGQMRVFEEHVWIDRTHRIHIFLDHEDKSIEVGYVGHHLPTATNPT